MDYLTVIAEAIRAEVPPEHRDGDDELFLIYALLVRAKGIETTAEDVHDAWATWKAIRGMPHDALVPFAQLSAEVQAQDAPFLSAIHRVARAQT
jgi:hypothetical protein